MSLAELLEIVKRIFPTSELSLESCRTYIQKNPNILPISRSGRYTLKEWSEKERRGGSIRKHIFDFLSQSLEPKSLSELVDFINSFGRNTTINSINSNICADESGRFSFYLFEGEKHIGLSTFEYDSCYLLYEYSPRKTVQQKFKLLDSFIQENQRFPFYNTEDYQEYCLARFYNNVLKSDKLIEIEKCKLLEIENKYRSLIVSKDDENWALQFDKLVQFISDFGRFPYRQENADLFKWAFQQKNKANSGELPETQIGMIQELILLISTKNNSIAEECETVPICYSDVIIEEERIQQDNSLQKIQYGKSPIFDNANPNNPFYNMAFVISGQFEIEKRELIDIIRRMGCRRYQSISNNVDFYIIGKNYNRQKHQQANDLSIQIITESELSNYFQ